MQSYQSLSRNYKLLSGSANQLLGLYEKQLDDVKYLANIGVLPKSQVISAEQSVVTYKSNQLQSQAQLTNSLTGFTSNLIKAAVVSTDPKFIDFMKLRLEFVAKGSFEAPSSAIPDALASAA